MRRFAFVAFFFVACKSDVAVTTTTSADACTSDSECTLTSLGDDCCDHCGQRALTKKALDDLHARCKDKHPTCPSIDCPFQPATAKCMSNRCVAAH
jgi:hypothetical protein